MRLADVIERYRAPLEARHGERLLPGHRSCPRCQNHEASEWLERQRAKLLPVEYFMVTFTLPAGLRGLAWCHQRTVFDLLMRVAATTLRDFARNPAKLGGELGLTAVLHTHARNLNFHPHCHVIVPGGAVDARRRQWRTAKGHYLFNGFALARVFRARSSRPSMRPVWRGPPGCRTSGSCTASTSAVVPRRWTTSPATSTAA